jgi:hypothetical protein
VVLPALAAVVLLACGATGLGNDDQRPPRRALQRVAPSWNNDWSRGAVPGGDELPMNLDHRPAAAIIQGVNAGDATVISSRLAEVQPV